MLWRILVRFLWKGDCELFLSPVCACRRLSYRVIMPMIGATYKPEGTEDIGHSPELTRQVQKILPVWQI